MKYYAWRAIVVNTMGEPGDQKGFAWPEKHRKKLGVKQPLTAKLIFERLRDEHTDRPGVNGVTRNPSCRRRPAWEIDRGLQIQNLASIGSIADDPKLLISLGLILAVGQWTLIGLYARTVTEATGPDFANLQASRSTRRSADLRSQSQWACAKGLAVYRVNLDRQRTGQNAPAWL